MVYGSTKSVEWKEEGDGSCSSNYRKEKDSKNVTGGKLLGEVVVFGSAKQRTIIRQNCQTTRKLYARALHDDTSLRFG